MAASLVLGGLIAWQFLLGEMGDIATRDGALVARGQLAQALDSKSTFLRLSDDKGKAYIVPLATLAYVEIGSEESRRVGFVA